MGQRMFIILAYWIAMERNLKREDRGALWTSPSFEREQKGGSYLQCKYVIQVKWITRIGSIILLIISLLWHNFYKIDPSSKLTDVFNWVFLPALFGMALANTIIISAGDRRLKKWAKITKGKRHMTQKEINAALIQMKKKH